MLIIDWKKKWLNNSSFMLPQFEVQSAAAFIKSTTHNILYKNNISAAYRLVQPIVTCSSSSNCYNSVQER